MRLLSVSMGIYTYSIISLDWLLVSRIIIRKISWEINKLKVVNFVVKFCLEVVNPDLTVSIFLTGYPIIRDLFCYHNESSLGIIFSAISEFSLAVFSHDILADTQSSSIYDF